MKKMLTIAVAFLFIGILTACTEEDEPNEAAEERIAPVEIEKATEGDLVVERSVFGRTSPNRLTPIMVQNPGEIDELEVEDGDTVEEDDRIAKLKTAVGTQYVDADESGKIVNLEAEEGSMVSDADPLAMIADMETMKLEFNVTSDMLAHIEKEDVFIAVINEKEYDAEITNVGEMPNDSGMYSVIATVDNEDEAILTGLVAKMDIPISRVKDTVLVPTAAIVDESDETFVYVIADDEAVKTSVTIRETQSGQTAVEADIQAGDQVVVNGQLLLSDGTKVSIVEESGE
ncbi:RND family efflux transporter, MFP subunit [Oceanobacillus limi]|uniref:RND family efflux transporter, MFP subunit n=1 Tax=Oceanobacillus limi TaxID=930131 RepID=A0A1I0A0L8_9BACI|nr:efflux RND transporter periplasmic adaptor subunit [Oceanobacillus limi]SES87571.1 RND family efflux transporter, MFP subunit [Oceanobacillus limi]